ncbi:serine/threonine protein kinase [Pendulispora brunnea]|uniref:Serine/threonine protein kinase n=1 Tax=Pendulispora brunnea TaxID=2905690 RepID=A0ABZ2KKH4_9BACT
MTQNPFPQRGPQRLGRYTVFAEIASGGMASVHLGRLMGSAGFSRTVAIKRLHPHLARNPDFVAMFLDEARLVSRIRHPNVVHTLDVVSDENELLIVMEYIQGESLARIIRAASTQGMKLPPTVASAILVGALDGLHAAHEATSERGTPLNIVHRDISPQNIIVGSDGVPRVLDFGVAKAAGRVHETKDGSVKGKFAYMSPEQLGRSDVDRRTDVFAAAIVLWETLTGERLFDGDNLAEIVNAVVNKEVPPPSSRVPELTPELDAVVMRGLAREADRRYASAHEFAVALEQVCRPASAREVGEWIEFLVGNTLRANRSLVERIESETSQPSEVPVFSNAATEMASAVTATPRPREQDPSFHSGSHSRSIAASASSLSASSSSFQSNVHGPGPRVPAFLQPFQESIVPWWKALGALALVTLVGLAGIYTMVQLWKPAKGNEPIAPVPSAAAPPPAVATETAAAPAPVPTAPAASASAPSEAASATAVPTDTATAPTSTSRKHRPHTGGASSASVDCENPFIIDSSGIKRPKPQCFGSK